MTKTLSYPREVAESLLAESLHDAEVVLAALRDLRPEVFHDVEHRALWRAIVEVFEHSGGAVDPVLVGDHLARTGQLEAVGGVDALTALAERVPYAAHFERHARTLTEYHNRWKLHTALMRRAEVALDPTISWEDVQEFIHLPDTVTNSGGRTIQTAAALIERYPTNRPVVIAGLLRQGEIATVINSAKGGKSWLLAQVALCIASGRDWLGHECTAGRVLIVDCELHGEVLAYRLRSLARAMELPEAVLGRVDTLALRGTGMTIDEITRKAHAWKDYRAIILDPLYKVLGDRDENANGAMAGLFALVDAAAEASGASWLIVHHSSKGQQSQKTVTDTGSGAGAVSRAADCHIVMRPHKVPGIVVMEAAVRSFPPFAPVCTTFDWPLWTLASEDLDPSDLAGLKPSPGEKSKAASQDAADDAEAVFAFLDSADGFQNLTPIVAGVSRGGRTMTERRVKTAVERLLQDKRIIFGTVKAGANNRRVPAYAVPNKAQQTDGGLLPVVAVCSRDKQDEQTARALSLEGGVGLSVCCEDVSPKKRSAKGTGKQRAARKRRPKKRLRQTLQNAPETPPDAQDDQSPEQDAGIAHSVAGEVRTRIVVNSADIEVLAKGGGR